jgi:hypothetical protein
VVNALVVLCEISRAEDRCPFPVIPLTFAAVEGGGWTSGLVRAELAHGSDSGSPSESCRILRGRDEFVSLGEVPEGGVMAACDGRV